MVNLSILIVNHNTAQITSRCVSSIFNQTHNLSFEVIVVDNASTDDSLKVIANTGHKIHWIQNEQNFGFARAVNQGVKEAKGAIVLVLNSDIILLDHEVNRIFEAFQNVEEKVGMANCSLQNELGEVQRSTFAYNASFYEVLSYNRLLDGLFRFNLKSRHQQINALHGASLIFKKDFFLSLGGFDPQFFLYSEEFDFARKVKLAGKELISFDQIILTHIGEASSQDKTWNLKQRFASIALLFRKTHGNFGLLNYYFLLFFNAICNGLLIWKMNSIERKDYFQNLKVHWAVLKWYIRILFMRKTSTTLIKV